MMNEGGYDDSCHDDYVGFEEWKSDYVKKGLNKWGRGVCWEWCEQGSCSDEFNCGQAHPILAIDSTPGGKGCRIDIKPCRALVGLRLNNKKSEESRLPKIEGIIKGLGFVEQDKNSRQQDQEPLVFESEAELSVCYAEKDEAKSLGAWWNPERKIWYVPAGRDVRPFERWSPKVSGKYVATMACDSEAYLTTTFQEKDEVKSLGACWDPERRKWYVPRGKTLKPFLKWNPKVNGRPVVASRTKTPTFINEDLDKASAIYLLDKYGFNYSLFEFTYMKRFREMEARYSDTGRGGEVQDDGVKPPAGLKRTRCSSPARGKDDRKLPAAVTPEKQSYPRQKIE
jgi:hypothetical protein